MLLVIDIGNSNILAGVFAGDDLVSSFRFVSDIEKSAGDYSSLFSESIEKDGIKTEEISSSIVSSVVPGLGEKIVDSIKNSFKIDPMQVDSKLKTGMPNLYDNPDEVGADRIVNSVAAFNKYKTALIVVDFGTATTFDCISEKGEYLGGAISPGITISSEALFERAAKLPRVVLERPGNIIGKNTTESIQSGIIFGYASMVDGMIGKISEKFPVKPRIVATGGLAGLIASESNLIEDVDEDLTLRGLRILYDLNE